MVSSQVVGSTVREIPRDRIRQPQPAVALGSRPRIVRITPNAVDAVVEKEALVRIRRIAPEPRCWVPFREVRKAQPHPVTPVFAVVLLRRSVVCRTGGLRFDCGRLFLFIFVF